MIYAVNLFDVIPHKKDTYRDYSVKAGRIIYGLGGRVLASGCCPETLVADRTRKCFILVEFPSREVFQKFHDTASAQDIHRLRESSTTNYIWQLFQPWNLKAWVRGGGSITAPPEGS